MKVDGENVSTYRVGDALTGVDLTEGSHQIEMNFTPSGLDMGSLISIVCIALFLFSAMLEQYSQKKKEQKKEPSLSRMFPSLIRELTMMLSNIFPSLPNRAKPSPLSVRQEAERQQLSILQTASMTSNPVKS